MERAGPSAPDSPPPRSITFDRRTSLPRTPPERIKRASGHGWPSRTAETRSRLVSPNWGISKWIDNIRFIGNNDTFGTDYYPQNISDLENERSSLSNRLPHRIMPVPIHDLPFGRGCRWGSSRKSMLDAVAGHWQISTVGSIRGGGYVGLAIDGGCDLRGDSEPGTISQSDLTGAPFKSPKPRGADPPRHRPPLAEPGRIRGT